ncbi:GntR family transcriptional regulator [Dermabacteraceae bacterium TAE3-ERU5]|nr:GntR family transcriptional regulator [Dermabacteraceae bacterium TAE3-ERU5]
MAGMRARAGESTVDAIKSFILEEGLRPGDPLPSESEICSDLGVSRSSVREAMRTLSSLDIVQVKHGRGTTVGGLSLSPFIAGLAFRTLLNEDGRFSQLAEVVQLREGVDRAIGESLIARCRGQRDPELSRLVSEMREQSAAGESFMQIDRAFHARLLEFVGNSLLAQIVTALWEVHTVVVPQLGIQAPHDIDETVCAHGHMLDAIEAGDLNAYLDAVGAHYLPLRRAIERAAAGAN